MLRKLKEMMLCKHEWEVAILSDMQMLPTEFYLFVRNVAK